MIRYIKYVLLIAFPVILAMCTNSKVDPGGSIDIGGIPNIPGLSGKGSSMARFSIANNTLYILRDNDVQLYDIANPKNPEFQSATTLNRGMETIFTYDTLVFFGSQNGMMVYSQTTAFNLEYVTEYNHFTSCDPVVFDGKYAYVTLNSASANCGRGLNELQVIDLSNMLMPSLIKTYPMTSPKGLGVDGDLLFICDNNSLEVYDKSNPMSLLSKASFDLNQAYDVIPYNNNLIVTSSGGISQFSYNLLNKTIQHLSSILVEQEK